MEDLKELEQQQQFDSDDENQFDDEDQDEDEDDEDEDFIMQQQQREREEILTQEQLLMQQYAGLDSEFINAGEDESDDGLVLAGAAGVLAGEANAASSGYNQMMFQDPNMEPEFAGMAQPIVYNGWIQWYLSLEDHDLLVEVDKDYIADKFNLIKLKENFPSKDRYKECLRLLLSNKIPNEEDLQNQKFLELNQDASDLYGLIHTRYIQSSTGLAKLYNKYLNAVYGHCPRALCDKQKVLPVGMSDKIRTSRVKVFCPRCEESYLPKYKNINLDGSFFGSSLPHLFIQHYPLAIIIPPKIYYYEPKMFGFRLFGKKGSKYYQPVKGGVMYTEDEESTNELIANFQQNLKLTKSEMQKSTQQQSGQSTQPSQSKKQKNKKNKRK